VDRTVDQLCEEFEQAWQRGSPIPIETLLQRSQAGDREGMLYELVRLEVGLRQASGEKPSTEEYLHRFPEQSAIVRSAMNSQAAVGFSTTLPLDPPKRTNRFPPVSETTVNNRKSIGRYTIVGTLGRGGQADVFRGIHPTLPIEVAIKLTRKTLSDKARDALKEEAHILCDLDHPHIARIRDFDFDVAEVQFDAVADDPVSSAAAG
jgi:Protein tyrosine and serine/threonine kinase